MFIFHTLKVRARAAPGSASLSVAAAVLRVRARPVTGPTVEIIVGPVGQAERLSVARRPLSAARAVGSPRSHRRLSCLCVFAVVCQCAVRHDPPRCCGPGVSLCHAISVGMMDLECRYAVVRSAWALRRWRARRCRAISTGAADRVRCSGWHRAISTCSTYLKCRCSVLQSALARMWIVTVPSCYRAVV